MIAVHRKTGTDRLGMVSGLMILESRRSFRDLPVNRMSVQDLVDMCQMDIGSGMKTQLH